MTANPDAVNNLRRIVEVSTRLGYMAGHEDDSEFQDMVREQDALFASLAQPAPPVPAAVTTITELHAEWLRSDYTKSWPTWLRDTIRERAPITIMPDALAQTGGNDDAAD